MQEDHEATNNSNVTPAIDATASDPDYGLPDDEAVYVYEPPNDKLKCLCDKCDDRDPQ